ncbi:citrate/2-methylcitrate synthase [Aliikangiella sp. G2MR2-5]|uniref:citrate/2-methylcitrate synthase n=1 Tax=Aliikangiella sp. G2MR2-5 TaxID=2788943 RepID=UPI0018A8B086|nr:citrate/2-methylcitrate synthase [Aliikangiella sp. G2MR2-5]
MGSKKHLNVEKRAEEFASRFSTKIFMEEPSKDNPFVASRQYCHGYDITELMEKKDSTDMLFLLFLGDLPNEKQKKLFNYLLISCMNQGLRNPGARAAICAGVGKTDPLHILPIGLSAFSCEHQGAGLTSQVMQSIRKLSRVEPRDVAVEINSDSNTEELEIHIIPGFGRIYNSIDEMSVSIGKKIIEDINDLKFLSWSLELSDRLKGVNAGILRSGLVSSILLDLGINYKYGSVIHQLISAPGILAHGMEYASKPLSSMPFVPDANYEIINDK